MSKKSRFTGVFDKSHNKWVATLFKSEQQDLYRIYWSLWRKFRLKKSHLVIWKFLGLFPSYWLPITSILLLMEIIFSNMFRCNYLRNEKDFLNFLFELSNFRFNFGHFQKNDDPHSWCVFKLTDSETRGYITV